MRSVRRGRERESKAHNQASDHATIPCYQMLLILLFFILLYQSLQPHTALLQSAKLTRLLDQTPVTGFLRLTQNQENVAKQKAGTLKEIL